MAAGWTPRQFAFAAGITLWIGSTLIQTRWGGIVALWTAALLVAGLTALTSATRTLTLQDLIQPFCMGGAMMGLAILAGAMFDAAFGTGRSGIRALGIPAIEEALKIAPILWVLWRRRRDWALTLGISDILLLAVACGAGFGFVEDAFIRHNVGWGGALSWLPTSEITGDRHGTYLVIGHGPMTAITGLTVGAALLFRRPRAQMVALALSGWLWAVLDHARNNYGNYRRDMLSGTLNFVTGHSYLTAYLLLLGIFVAVAVDFYFAYIALPASREINFPSRPNWEQLKNTMHFLRLRHQLAYATAREGREVGTAKAQAITVASRIDAALAKRST